MEEIKDILKSKGYDEEHLKANPFSAPENYFSSIEDSVRSKIKAEQERLIPWYEKLYESTKSYAMLAFMFGIIFGMGYGVLSITSSLNPDAFSSEENTLVALVDDGFISSDFIEDYYDDIDISSFGSNDLEEAINSSIEDGASIIQEELSEADLMEYYLGY